MRPDASSGQVGCHGVPFFDCLVRFLIAVPMSLEQAIHDRWASDAALPLLVPPARFTTGPAWSRPELPYAQLHRQGQRSRAGGSHYRLEEVELGLVVQAETLTQLKTVLAAVVACFDNAAFDLAAGSVLRMRLIDQREERSSEGTWQGTLTWLAVVAT